MNSLNDWISMPCLTLLDKRVVGLSNAQFRWWMNLNMVAKTQGGVIHDLEDAAILTRTTTKKLIFHLKELESLRFFLHADGSWIPVLIVPVGFVRSNSRQRMKRLRIRKSHEKRVRQALVVKNQRTEMPQNFDIHRQDIPRQGPNLSSQTVTGKPGDNSIIINKNTKLFLLSTGVLNHLNRVARRNFVAKDSSGQPSPAIISIIRCLQNGSSKDDLINLIDYQSALCVNETERRARLTPSNLFRWQED